MDKKILLFAADLLEEASEIFSNRGCSDYPIENTPDNLEFYRRVYEWMTEDMDEFPEIGDDDKDIYLEDWVVMDFCAEKLREYADEK